VDRWRDFVQPDPGSRGFRVRRDIFSDPEIFKRELKVLFEGGWIYLAHECQVPAPHDYVTTFAGRRPILVMRDKEGVVRAFHNACPHRGATVCAYDRGNAPLHVCPYHSWSFASDGRNRAIKAKAQGGYNEAFLSAAHDLKPISRFESYRGFLFGSLSPDVPSLAEYLGDARFLIDLMVDQSADGIEFAPGVVNFTYDGNWKHQLENSADGYHVTSVHPTFVTISQQRAEEDARSAVGGVWDRAASQLTDTSSDAQYGSFTFPNGHLMIWSAGAMAPGHPLFGKREELIERVGPVRAKWMFYARNLTIFPNLQIADNFSSQLRVMRPLAPGRTEMTSYCISPRGEGAAARTQRLRQYEDFFMPSGMATSDDLIVYERCQEGDTGASETWQTYDRGAAVLRRGCNEEAVELGITPDSSVRGPGQLWDEMAMHAYYRAWIERMTAADHLATGAEKAA
jgi:benzoate/toluate 1,2-dioxygenase subunit alpha